MASFSTGTTLSQPPGSTAPVITSMQSAAAARVSGASPAACVAWMRKDRPPTLTALLSSATPSMATRS